MKKILSGLLLFILVLPLLGAPALAADIDLIADASYLLTDEEYWDLNDLADQIAADYSCDVAVVTVDDLEGNDAYELAKWIYQKYNFGYGSDNSGMLLLLCMEERDYALVAFGFGNTAFTDHGKDVLLDKHVLPLLADDKYYEAFETYLNTSAEYLSMARAGTPFDFGNDPDMAGRRFLTKLAVVILLPLLIAGLLCQMWKKQMKTAVLAVTADQYIPENGFHLTGQEDLFLFRTESRRKIEKKTSGGTTVDRSGASGRSGKF